MVGSPSGGGGGENVPGGRKGLIQVPEASVAGLRDKRADGQERGQTGLKSRNRNVDFAPSAEKGPAGIREGRWGGETEWLTGPRPICPGKAPTRCRRPLLSRRPCAHAVYLNPGPWRSTVSVNQQACSPRSQPAFQGPGPADPRVGKWLDTEATGDPAPGGKGR